MSGQRTTVLQPALRRLRRGEVLHQGAHLRPIVEHGHDVTSHQERLAVGRINPRQVEEAVVLVRLRSLREEPSDEVALLVHPALGRILEHRRRRVPEEGGHDRRRATIHVVVVEPDLGQSLSRVLHLGGGKRQLAGGPLVVVLQAGGAEHELLHPVRGRPARGSPRLDADAPGSVPIGHNHVHQGDQLVPGLGDRIASSVEVVLGIPHQALAVEAMPDTSRLALYIRHLKPAIVVLLLQPGIGDERRRIHDLPLADKAGQQARLREVGDVRSVARIHADGDGALELLVADVVHGDAGGLLEGIH